MVYNLKSFDITWIMYLAWRIKITNMQTCVENAHV